MDIINPVTSQSIAAALSGAESVGTWTPVFTFVNPGDISVTYSTQSGNWVKIGSLVYYQANINSSAFTYTTANGQAIITGLPFTTKANTSSIGPLNIGGITAAGYTAFSIQMGSSATAIGIRMGGTGVANAAATEANFPTGATLFFRLSGILQV